MLLRRRFGDNKSLIYLDLFLFFIILFCETLQVNTANLYYKQGHVTGETAQLQSLWYEKRERITTNEEFCFESLHIYRRYPLHCVEVSVQQVTFAFVVWCVRVHLLLAIQVYQWLTVLM